MVQLLATLRSEKALVPILGLALCHSWILSPFLSGNLFYVCFHTGLAICYLVFAVKYYLNPKDTYPFSKLSYVAAAMMAAGTIGALLITDESYVVLQVVTGLLGGVGSAYCFMRLFMSFSSLTMKTAISSTLIAFIFSGCIRLLLVGVQNVSELALTIIFCIVPFCVAYIIGKSPCPESGAVYMALQGKNASGLQKAQTEQLQGGINDAPTVPAGPRRGASKEGLGGDVPAMVLEILAYGFVFGLLRNGINEWSTSTTSMLLGHVLRIIIPVLMLWWLIVRTHNSQTPIFKLAVLMVSFIILAVLFFGGLGEIVLSSIVLAARSVVSILIYIRAFEVMHRAKLHPMVAYGVGRGSYEIALVLGLLAYTFASNSGFMHMLSFDVYYFFVSCVLLLLINGFSGAMKLPFLQSIPVPANTAFDDSCASIAQTYNLTEREIEVMRLICKGHTKKRIADMLSVSEDTIRYHSKNLYQKLDIHSRQELLDMVSDWQ